MALKSLSQIRAVMKEPQLLHKWQVDIPTWPAVASPANPDVLFLITTTSLPSDNSENAKIQLGGYTLNYNGKSDRNGEIEWTFYENTDSDVLNYFLKTYSNFRQNFSSTADISLKSSNTSDLIAPVVNMNLLDPSGNRITQTFQLINCMFRVSQLGGELGQEAEAQRPTVVVTYDSFVMK